MIAPDIEIVQTFHPGVYEDMPAAVYHSLPGASASRLKLMDEKSPAHVLAEMSNPTAGSDAMAFGEACHVAVLQPDLFLREYAIEPDFGDCRFKDNKARRDAWRTENAARKILPGDDYRKCVAIRESVMAHPKARQLIEAATSVETSALWDDAATGTRCKLRADILADGAGVLGDLKTTVCAKPGEFEWSVYKFRYHLQFAHYLNGLAALGRAFEDVVLIAVEKDPPYAVAVYRLSDAAMAEGNRKLRPLLERWADCERSNHWPAYGDGLTEVGIPEHKYTED